MEMKKMSPKRTAVTKSGKVVLRALSVAALAGLSIAGAQAQAQNSYDLIKVSAPGKNTITKYEWNEATQKHEPVYYTVKVKNVGDKSSATSTHYYKWTQPSVSDAYTFDEVPSKDADFSFFENASNLSERIDNPESGASINKDFVGITERQTGLVNGGAINHDNGTTVGNPIKNISGNFIGNSGESETYSVYGGAIHCKWGSIDEISGKFLGNHAKAVDTASGGAVYYNGYNSAVGNKIQKIEADFIGNYVEADAKAFGGAITSDTVIIGNIKGDFVGNIARAKESEGGAIFSIGGNISSISGNFIGNSAIGKGGLAYGGALVSARTTLGQLNANFIGNYAESDGGDAFGGALYDYFSKNTNGIVNSSFINNHAKTSGNGKAQGGAIYASSPLDIIAKDGGVSIFKGNYVESAQGKEDQAIYVATPVYPLSLTQTSNGKMYMYDSIDGFDGYTLSIKGDGTGTFYMFNDIKNGNVTFDNTTISTVNNDIHQYDFRQLNVASAGADFLADVNLQEKTMDSITSKNAPSVLDGKINVVGLNVYKNPDKYEDRYVLNFTDGNLKNNVTTSIGELPTNNASGMVYTPIYKYGVEYKTSDELNGAADVPTDETFDDGLETFSAVESQSAEYADGGYFVLTRGDKLPSGTTGGGSGKPSDAFNPAVLSAPVTTQAAGQAVMTETFRYVFEHADAFTQLPEVVRTAKINGNKYALSTDYNNNLGSLDYSYDENKAGWLRPFTSFEKIDLKNGPKVDAITYGTLAGFDTDFHHHRNGWTSVGTGYIGYTGSQLSYKGVDTSMNGGLVGMTETFYKGNFWTALTASVGAGVANTKTMYGHEDSAMLLAGVASKTGYNFEFKEGKYIFQPIMQLSYTFINTFDYTNAAGVRIKSDPMHTLQLNPTLRFISNFKNGWQPYAQVGMVWNLMNEASATANNVALPNMHTKPYIEYGLGLQRNWNDKFTAFGQAMVRNGGRNGIALTAGFRWAIGRDTNKSNDKVEKPVGKTDRVSYETSKTIMKQLSSAEKSADKSTLTAVKRTVVNRV